MHLNYDSNFSFFVALVAFGCRLSPKARASAPLMVLQNKRRLSDLCCTLVPLQGTYLNLKSRRTLLLKNCTCATSGCVRARSLATALHASCFFPPSPAAPPLLHSQIETSGEVGSCEPPTEVIWDGGNSRLAQVYSQFWHN